MTPRPRNGTVTTSSPRPSARAYPITNKCVDVPNGNSADGTDLILFACAGGPNQQWSFGDTTTYVHGADGNRLIQETGSSRTLYLGESEITVNKARTFGKATGHTLTVTLSDHHGTGTTSIDQAAGQAISNRKFDPYGNVRGGDQNKWPDKRTFLGVGTDDNTTGLTHIGAREYDPSTGRFLSVAPIIDITDPLQMNGYTYSNGDPVNQSDPTGLESASALRTAREATGRTETSTRTTTRRPRHPRATATRAARVRRQRSKSRASRSA
ncbi:RHS repeat-associated core domain-containing protein [Streptomyces sp. NBC_01214]|uniref:RHS repeat-associated core domain-containing protein n=1 Tax=Streptomyces sp. NBC_01214 TaxID=2903777 RepID=UPI00338E66A3